MSEATALVHLNNAAEKISEALREYTEGKIDVEELERRVNEVRPLPHDIGYQLNHEDHSEEDHSETRVNTKPVPENADVAVYFYMDEDGVLRMTVRYLNHEDNAKITEDDEATLAEAAPLEILRLIHAEHQAVIGSFMMHATLSNLREGDDDLSEIEDEETREQVRKFLH